jgi:hypothetical protein
MESATCDGARITCPIQQEKREPVSLPTRKHDRLPKVIVGEFKP